MVALTRYWIVLSLPPLLQSYLRSRAGTAGALHMSGSQHLIPLLLRCPPHLIPPTPLHPYASALSCKGSLPSLAQSSDGQGCCYRCPLQARAPAPAIPPTPPEPSPGGYPSPSQPTLKISSTGLYNWTHASAPMLPSSMWTPPQSG